MAAFLPCYTWLGISSAWWIVSFTSGNCDESSQLLWSLMWCCIFLSWAFFAYSLFDYVVQSTSQLGAKHARCTSRLLRLLILTLTTLVSLAIIALFVVPFQR